MQESTQAQTVTDGRGTTGGIAVHYRYTTQSHIQAGWPAVGTETSSALYPPKHERPAPGELLIQGELGEDAPRDSLNPIPE